MEKAPLPGPNDIVMTAANTYPQEPITPPRTNHSSMKPNQVGQVILYGVPIVSLVIDSQERLCLAQISNTLLKNYSYNEIHNRRVALGITCVQCTPVQLEILRRAGAMPISSRRCGMITKREAERLCKSFLGENSPPKLPDNFAFDVSHECAWGCRGSFIPARYNSSRAKCIKCSYCNMYFSPNKFIFHSHRTPEAKYTQPDAANFNSWRRHLKLTDKTPPEDLAFAWEDVKAMFNGGSRKRALPQGHCSSLSQVKAVGSVLPHMIAPDLAQKRARFEEDEDVNGTSLSPRKNPRNYPVIPVPSKSFGMLQKFPATSLFPNPYTFPAFSLCQKKDDGESGNGQKPSGLSGLLWPGRKDAFYPPFCMFWPPRTPGGIPVPTYLQPQPNALTSLTENATLRQAFLDLSDQSDAANMGNPRGNLFESDCPPANTEVRTSSDGRLKLLDMSSFQTRKPSYHSAFRPVVKDAESIAKLHGNLEEFGPDRHLSPGTSCSYQSDSADSDEEQEVDVETNKQQEEEDDFGSGQCTQSHKIRANTQAVFTTKENSNYSGDSGQEEHPPVSLKKDVENMEKEQLQKVLLEQIDLRRRLEQEFHVLKGSATFPVFTGTPGRTGRETIPPPGHERAAALVHLGATGAELGSSTLLEFMATARSRPENGYRSLDCSTSATTGSAAGTGTKYAGSASGCKGSTSATPDRHGVPGAHPGYYKRGTPHSSRGAGVGRKWRELERSEGKRKRRRERRD
ncbi:SKR1B protein, partial [Polypterus senegalus]